MSDKMRELLEECLEILQAENWRGDLQDDIWGALTQQPESELKGTVGNCYGPDNKGLYRVSVFSGSPFPVGTTVYASPQPSAQVPEGWREAAQEFVDWVECGGEHRKNTYRKFKELLAAPSIAEKDE